MGKTRSSTQTVMGHRLPPPALTVWARIYMLFYLGGPILLGLGLLDLLLFLLFRYAFNSCYGVFCLI